MSQYTEEKLISEGTANSTMKEVYVRRWVYGEGATNKPTPSSNCPTAAPYVICVAAEIVLIQENYRNSLAKCQVIIRYSATAALLCT